MGGVNVLAVDDGIVAHAAVDERLLKAADRALRTGYVDGVATAANQRRRGLRLNRDAPGRSDNSEELRGSAWQPSASAPGQFRDGKPPACRRWRLGTQEDNHPPSANPKEAGCRARTSRAHRRPNEAGSR
jgi:hypothetical protein